MFFLASKAKGYECSVLLFAHTHTALHKNRYKSRKFCVNYRLVFMFNPETN